MSTSNICNYSPMVNFSLRGINHRFHIIHRYLCYALAAAGSNLTQVYTTDSASVTWSGTGTQADPLIATSVGASGANPSASLGLTAINGAAATFMRSDAAPALSQAIIPTWTGNHIFSFISTVPDPTIRLSSSNPQITFTNTAGAVNEKNWNFYTTAGGFALRSLDDANANTNSAFLIARTGNVVTQHDYYTGNVSRMQITSAGNVNIGSTGTGKVNIGTGTSAITSSGNNEGLTITSATLAFNRLYFENLGSTAGSRVFAFDNSNGVFSLGSYTDIATGTVISSIISMDHTTGAVVANSRLGVGITPLYAIHTETTTPTQAIVNTAGLSATGGGSLYLFTKALPNAAGNNLGGIYAGSRNAASAESFGASVQFNSNGAWTNGSNHGAHIDFFTAPSNSGTPQERMRIQHNGNIGMGVTSATAAVHIKAGSATASTAPLKFTSGTLLTTAEAGAMEYNGTNLSFTRVGTTRETVITASAVTTEAVVSDTTVTININGVTYKLLALA